MKHFNLPLLGAAAILALTLSACGGGGASSSSMATLAEGSDPAVNSGAVSSGALVSQEERHMMTVDETLEYFKSLDPKDLGLTEDSMDRYQVYPSEKAIPVDNLPCMKIIAYRESEEGVKYPEATFLIARDGTAVYLLDEGTVVKII